jgi:plastocyanin
MRKILILLAAVAVLAAGCGSGSSTASSSGTPVQLPGNTANKGTKDLSGASLEIDLVDYGFSPTFVKGGTPGSTLTVHLKNQGKNPHTFTSTALGVDKQLNPGESADVQVTLPQSGATEFHCTFHQQSNGMQGAFFFKDGDTVAGAAAPASNNTTTTSGGYYGN